jgi:hypothetical protein
MIKKIMQSLDPPDARLLYYAFENDLTQVVRIGDKFIAVNLVPNNDYEIIEEKGAWTYGRTRNNQS